MCKKVEAVLEEGVDMPIRCEVTMDGETTVSDDFIAVLSREDGSAGVFYNTDALTLGMAMKMISKAFVDSMHALPEEERETVTNILGGDFSVCADEEETTEEV